MQTISGRIYDTFAHLAAPGLNFFIVSRQDISFVIYNLVETPSAKYSNDSSYSMKVNLFLLKVSL